MCCAVVCCVVVGVVVILVFNLVVVHVVAFWCLLGLLVLCSCVCLCVVSVRHLRSAFGCVFGLCWSLVLRFAVFVLWLCLCCTGLSRVIFAEQ